MFLLRSARLEDYSDILRLSRELNSVNLPNHPKDLRNILHKSVKSFSGDFKKASPHAQFLFVLEDTTTSRVIGTSKIFARHGTPQRPHLYFQVGQEKVYSKTLKVNFLRKYFRLKADPRGYTEIGGLVVDPKYRGHPEKLGKQLSLIRFVFMKAHPSWFKRRVIAELLPPLHGGSHSTLYDFYGARLTRLSYKKADRLSYRNKEFILKLFPRTDLYFDILPPEVQEDVEKVGEGSQAALHLLSKIGFKYANQIDPLDGGPYYTAIRESISVYRQTLPRIFVGTEEINPSKSFLVLSEGKGELRATVSGVRLERKGVLLPPSTQSVLKLRAGQRVFIYPWK